MRTECARSPILMVFSKTKLSKLGQQESKGWGKDEGEAEELVCFLFLNNSISKWICFISVQVDGIADFCAVTGRMWTGPRHQKSNGTAFMVLRCCVHSVSPPLSPFGSFRLFYCYHYKVLIRIRKDECCRWCHRIRCLGYELRTYRHAVCLRLIHFMEHICERRLLASFDPESVAELEREKENERMLLRGNEMKSERARMRTQEIIEWPEWCVIWIMSSNAKSSSKSEINVNYFCLDDAVVTVPWMASAIIVGIVVGAAVVVL